MVTYFYSGFTEYTGKRITFDGSLVVKDTTLPNLFDGIRNSIWQSVKETNKIELPFNAFTLVALNPIT